MVDDQKKSGNKDSSETSETTRNDSEAGQEQADSHNQNLEANFSTLILSIASSAAMALGLAPNPNTGETQQDLKMAQFNIDLLILLRKKTAGNLEKQEEDFLSNVISDLQMKFIQQRPEPTSESSQ